MNIIDALDDPNVFAKSLRGDTWKAWLVFLKALFALPMSAEEFDLYRQCTGRSAPPTAAAREAWLVVGRRGGKSFILATIAAFLALFTDWRPFLGPGEYATIMIVAADRKQARVDHALYRRPAESRADAQASDRECHAREHYVEASRLHRNPHRLVPFHTRLHNCRSTVGRALFWEVDETSANPDTEVVMPFAPQWRQFPALCCSAHPARTQDAVHCGRATENISAKTTIPCWSGRHQHER